MSLKKTALIITIISIACKLFGFLREIVLAYFLGTSYVVDAYLMASSIPGILFGWLVSLAVSYTPIYTDIRANAGRNRSEKYTSDLLSIVFLIAVACTLIGIIFSRFIVSVTAPGFNGEVYELTVKYLKISVLIVMFSAATQILTSYLNCNNRFIQSSLATLTIAIIPIVMIVVAGVFGNNWLIYGIVLSNAFNFIIIYIFSRQIGYRYKFKIEFNSEIKRAFIIVIPMFISSMISQINTFVDKSFASGLAEGSISALNYGAILRNFIISIFSIALTTMIYPLLSQAVAEKNMDKVKSILTKGVNIIIVLFVPITAGAIILAKPAVSFVFQRGEFDSISAVMTTTAFVMYSIGLLAVALRDVITKVFYSMQDTRSTLYIGAFAVGTNILLNIILVKVMGHGGLALATSISATISIPIFFIVLRKKIGPLGLRYSCLLFIKAAAATLIMGLCVYLSYRLFSANFGTGKLFTLLSIGVSAAIGGVIYLILMIFMRVKEMSFFTDIVVAVLKKIMRNV